MTAQRIWTVDDVLGGARVHNNGLLVEHLGIEFVAIGDDWLEARMPVVQHNKQPAGCTAALRWCWPRRRPRSAAITPSITRPRAVSASRSTPIICAARATASSVHVQRRCIVAAVRRCGRSASATMQVVRPAFHAARWRCCRASVTASATLQTQVITIIVPRRAKLGVLHCSSGAENIPFEPDPD